MLWLTCIKLQSFFASNKPSVRIPLLCFASETSVFALIWRYGVAALLRFISAVVLFGPLMGVFSKLTLLRQNWNLLYVTFLLWLTLRYIADTHCWHCFAFANKVRKRSHPRNKDFRGKGTETKRRQLTHFKIHFEFQHFKLRAIEI